MRRMIEMSSKMTLPCEACPLGATRGPCRPTQGTVGRLRAANNWNGAETLILCQGKRIDGGVVKDGLTRLDTFPLLRARVEGLFRASYRRRGEIIKRNGRLFSPALAFLFDGDGFGGLNKKYDHDFGDRGILALANLVRQITRAEDFFGLPDRPGNFGDPPDYPYSEPDGDSLDKYDARRGGDEFVALLFGIPNLRAAEAKAAEVRDICRQGTTLWAPDSTELHLTATVGASYIEQPSEPRDVFWAVHLAGLALQAQRAADPGASVPALELAGPVPPDYNY